MSWVKDPGTNKVHTTRIQMRGCEGRIQGARLQDWLGQSIWGGDIENGAKDLSTSGSQQVATSMFAPKIDLLGMGPYIVGRTLQTRCL